MKELDLRNKSCPIPLVETRKFINENKGEDFKIIINNEVSFLNIKKFLENNKLNYSSNKSEENYVFEVIFDGNEKISEDNFKIENLSVLIMSSVFGEGDEEISKTLMKSYFYALNESITLPSNIIFINSGVKLLTEEYGILENLRLLKARGVSVLACGICTDYYKLNEKIEIAEISNMYSIIEILNNSGSVIRI